MTGLSGRFSFSMDHPYLIDKPDGATPLEALGVLRSTVPGLADAKLAYAGRLDPMATGLLVVLHGPLLHRQEEFWTLEKEYEARIVVGLTTDSDDLLGMCGDSSGPVPVQETLLAAASGLVGKHLLPVPVFSSARAAGKPLFAWARDGAVPQVPLRRMVVRELDVRDIVPVTAGEILADARTRIPRVRGDFRQEHILSRWEDVCVRDGQWVSVRIRAVVSGGTYVRSLARELGRRTGGGAFVRDLRRTRVGPWHISDAAVIRPVGAA